MPKRLGTAVKQSTPKLLTLQLHSASVQFSSVAQSCPTLCTPWIAARQASLSITNSRSSLKLMSIESVMSAIMQMESWPPILHNLHLSPDIVPDSYQLSFRAQHDTYTLWTQTPATSRGTFNGVRISEHIRTYCKTRLSLPRGTV